MILHRCQTQRAKRAVENDALFFLTLDDGMHKHRAPHDTREQLLFEYMQLHILDLMLIFSYVDGLWYFSANGWATEFN